MTGYMPAQTLLLALIKTMPQFQDTYAASTISFDTASRKILDSAAGLAWIAAGDVLTVTGSTLNDGTYTVVSSAAGFALVNEDLVDELAGGAVTLTRPANATEGDNRVLDQGVTNACFLYPGPLAEYDTAGMVRSHAWEAFADLLVRFTGETSYNAFGTLRDAFVTKIDAVKCLSADYFITRIRGDGDPQEVGPATGTPYFITQRLRIRIEEQV